MSEFGKAFRKARSSGAKEFTWRGKKYNTKIAEEAKKPAEQIAKVAVARQAMTAAPPPRRPMPSSVSSFLAGSTGMANMDEWTPPAPASVQVPLPPPATMSPAQIAGLPQGGPRLPGMKKGGTVKKLAKGGSVNSASKRGDGIAQRGKTRA